MTNKEKVVETVMSVDKANMIVIEELEKFDFTDKEKLKQAKEMIESAYTLILNSLT